MTSICKDNAQIWDTCVLCLLSKLYIALKQYFLDRFHMPETCLFHGHFCMKSIPDPLCQLTRTYPVMLSYRLDSWPPSRLTEIFPFFQTLNFVHGAFRQAHLYTMIRKRMAVITPRSGLMIFGLTSALQVAQRGTDEASTVHNGTTQTNTEKQCNYRIDCSRLITSLVASVHLSVLVCQTYVVHHFNDTELRCVH